jgi:tripartite ATP-independent transporter DctM subunit
MYLPIIIALVLYFTGIPIAYALMAGTLYYFGFVDTTSKTYLLLQKFITATQSFPLLAIPFFIMAGSIMNYSGMSDKLMAFADALTGHTEGGLAQMNVLLSMLMGGCSGSANADAAMECKMLVPEMEKRGYGKGFSAAITAASSCITPIIPPGINLIVYGLIAGASVGKLFAAGYLPGFLMAGALMVAVHFIAKKRGYAPSRTARATGKQIAKQALDSFWALFFPLGIIMGMRMGLFTPTEAGGVGILYCFLIGKFVYKGLRKEHFLIIFRETIAGTCTVMLIIVAANLFGYYLTWENIPNNLLKAVSGIASNKYLVLLILNVALLIMGMFLEGGAALMIATPLLLPVAQSLGVDVIHFGLVCIVNIMIGGITPPFGSMMFTTCGITRCRIGDFIKEVWPFILCLFLVLLLITFVPFLVTMVPDWIYGPINNSISM